MFNLKKALTLITAASLIGTMSVPAFAEETATPETGYFFSTSIKLADETSIHNYKLVYDENGNPSFVDEEGNPVSDFCVALDGENVSFSVAAFDSGDPVSAENFNLDTETAGQSDVTVTTAIFDGADTIPAEKLKLGELKQDQDGNYYLESEDGIVYITARPSEDVSIDA